MYKYCRCAFFLLPVIFLIMGCEFISTLEGSPEEDSALNSSPYPTQQYSEEISTTTTIFHANTSVGAESGELETYASSLSDGYRPIIIDLLIFLQENMLGYQYDLYLEDVTLPVSNVFFYSYCNWYEPNTSLEITLSEINETSVSNSLTVSIEASLGVSIGPDYLTGDSSIGASISSETTETVTVSQGIEVGTSYDLTKYDQSKLYKVILVGEYNLHTYSVSIMYNGQKIDLFDFLEVMASSLTLDENDYSKAIDVDADSLTVKLVHKID